MVGVVPKIIRVYLEHDVETFHVRRSKQPQVSHVCVSNVLDTSVPKDVHLKFPTTSSGHPGPSLCDVRTPEVSLRGDLTGHLNTPAPTVGVLSLDMSVTVTRCVRTFLTSVVPR